MRPVFCFLLFVPVSFAQSGREPLNQGVDQFKQQHYAEAAELFRQAVAADQGNVTAHLYLGTALEMQFVPGLDSDENLHFADQARQEFKKVLDLKPDNVLALSSLASLAYNQKRFVEARDWNQQVVAVDPNNKEAYYTLGVLAWTEWLPVDRQARVDSGQTPEDAGPIGDARLRSDLKEKWLPSLDAGIQDMESALRIDPHYDDAMSYMNLLIRYRADLLGTKEDWQHAAAEADDWMRRALDAKKENSGVLLSSAPSTSAPPVDGSQPLRIGMEIARANLLSKKTAVYPELARRERIAGIVRLNVSIAASGQVDNVTLISGPPMLGRAAMEAVKQWIYKPTLLNGNPVPVLTTVEVNFSLSR